MAVLEIGLEASYIQLDNRLTKLFRTSYRLLVLLGFPRKKFGTLIRCSRFSVIAVVAEVCEELFTSIPLHAELALNGVEVFMNSSGSHHQLRKLDLRLRDFIGATHSRGGVYMYNNHQGCDGGRLYYDGCSCVVVNGDVVAQGSQFSLKDVEVVVAQIDLDAISISATSSLQSYNLSLRANSISRATGLNRWNLHELKAINFSFQQQLFCCGFILLAAAFLELLCLLLGIKIPS